MTTRQPPSDPAAHEPLLEEDALEVRRIVELAEWRVAELAIEAGGLEGERVDPGRVAAALERPALGRADERPPDALAPQRFGYPKIFDEQPAAISLPRQPGDDASSAAGEYRERAPWLMARPVACLLYTSDAADE